MSRQAGVGEEPQGAKGDREAERKPGFLGRGQTEGEISRAGDSGSLPGRHFCKFVQKEVLS